MANEKPAQGTPEDSPFQRYLLDLEASIRPIRDGRIATYIPELAKANPDWFAISVVTVDGQCFDAGNFIQRFTIQSVSKPFMYGLVLSDHGREKVASRIGVEPTGDPFNSIIELDQDSHRPHNPMVNAGAIATAGLVVGDTFPDRVSRMTSMFARYAGRPLDLDLAVYASERSTGHRNRALAHLLRNFDMLDGDLDEALDLYFQQCSLRVASHDLAVMGATLANGGVNPRTGVRAIDSAHIRSLLSVMYTCGMYDYAGQWAYDVGLPAKSGVGGGICVVVPGIMGIGVFSPLLDAKGNSLRGVKACQKLSSDFGLHVFSGSDHAELKRMLPGTFAT